MNPSRKNWRRWIRGIAELAVAAGVLLSGGCDSSDSGSKGSETASGAYLITVYYTAVESFHGGSPETVKGRLSPESTSSLDVLGDYPSDFVAAVKSEGTGRITSGGHAGHYLNWSYDIGFWLDQVPANAYGGALQSFRTAAADPAVLPRGTRFKLAAPLIQDNGAPLDDSIAARFLSAEWDVDDQFTPGYGGDNHLDLYIGEENQPDFTETSPLYITLKNVAIQRR